MATTGKQRKRKRVKRTEKTARQKLKAKNLKLNPHEEDNEDEFQDPDSESSSSDSDSESDSESLSSLLEPYSKEHLINIICEAALKDPTLFDRVRELADRDVSHRQIFVHGLSWDTTSETLASTFEPFGEIEKCNVVLDKNTGKAKGYGFVLFKTRRAAVKALKNPQKKIKNRLASCQLASVGPVAGGPAATHHQAQDVAGQPRKIYVSNVPTDTDPEKLRDFFAKFGDIETGPIGFDTQTGKSRGFALFVYKSPEGFRKALQEPYKMFEGHQLHCQKAADGKSKNQSAQPPQPQLHSQVQPQLQPMLAAPNLAMFGQYPGFNPMYAGFLTNPAAGMIPGPVNPAMVGGTLSQGVIPTSQVGQVGAGVHGLGGLGGGGSSSMLGSFGTTAPPTTLQGLQQVYPSPQLGQAASGRVQGTGGAITGYPTYTWYDISLFTCLFSSFLFLFLSFNFLLCLFIHPFGSFLFFLFSDSGFIGFHCFSNLFLLICLILLLLVRFSIHKIFTISTYGSFCGFFFFFPLSLYFFSS